MTFYSLMTLCKHRLAQVAKQVTQANALTRQACWLSAKSTKPEVNGAERSKKRLLSNDNDDWCGGGWAPRTSTNTKRNKTREKKQINES